MRYDLRVQRAGDHSRSIATADRRNFPAARRRYGTGTVEGSPRFISYRPVDRCGHSPNLDRRPARATRKWWVGLDRNRSCDVLEFHTDRGFRRLRSSRHQVPAAGAPRGYSDRRDANDDRRDRALVVSIGRLQDPEGRPVLDMVVDTGAQESAPSRHWWGNSPGTSRAQRRTPAYGRNREQWCRTDGSGKGLEPVGTGIRSPLRPSALAG